MPLPSLPLPVLCNLNRRCLSPGELPGLGTLAEEDCAEEEEEEEEEEEDGECTGRRSFLYDSFAGGGSLQAGGGSRKHTSSVWRRELVIAGVRPPIDDGRSRQFQIDPN